MYSSILIRNKKFGDVLLRQDVQMIHAEYGQLDVGTDTLCNITEDDDAVSRKSLEYEPVWKNLSDLLEAHYDMTGSFDSIDIKLAGQDIIHNLFTIHYDVIIKHGDIEIKNEYNEFTLLKGVYTKTSFMSNIKRTKFRDISIFRDTFNEIEAKLQYVHSHGHRINILNSRPYNKGFSSMCLGTAAITKFKRGRKHQDMFMYLAYLDSFLRWESLDGGPYIKIHELYHLACGNKFEIKNVDIDDIIYKNAENITAFIDNKGEISASSDIVNHIEDENLKCVSKSGHVMSEDGWHVNHIIDSETPRIFDPSVKFKGEDIKIRIIDYDNSKMKKYVQSCFNHVPQDIGNEITKRVNQILKIYYEPTKQEVSDLQPEGEGETHSN